MALKKKPKNLKRTDGVLDDWAGWLVNHQQEGAEPSENAVLFDKMIGAVAHGAMYMFSCTQCEEHFTIKPYCLLYQHNSKFFVRLFDGDAVLGDLDERQLNVIRDAMNVSPDEVDYDKFFCDIFGAATVGQLQGMMQKRQLEYKRDTLKKELAEVEAALKVFA